MAYKWLAVTEDFDRSLAIKKWRYDVNNPITGNYDGALAELPNIAVEGKSGPQMSGAANGYAFENRFNAGKNYFSSRYYGWTDHYWTATTTSHTTLISGTTYEFECPVDLYWAGIWGNVAFNPELTNMMWFYVDAITFETDIDSITANYSGTSTSVTVTADSGLTWTASTSDSWISITNPTGSGNGSFTVVVSANATHSSKTGTVTVTSNTSDVLTISVSQEKRPSLISQKPLYRSGESVAKMYRSGELIYLKVNPQTAPPEPPAPTYQWVEVTSGFDRTLAFTKVRWATGATWNDGFFSELPNINCDGKGWTGIQSAEWGYAGWYTQNLNNKKFFERTGATSYATRNMSSPTCTLTDDALTPVSWEYEYQVPLYWGGMSNTGNYTVFNGGTGLYVYVKVTTE